LVSLVIIGAVAAVAGGTTMSVFSDTEESPNNTFATGALDLKIDYTESYNGEVQEEQNLTDDPGQIFNLSDVKPGDTGEATISFHVFDNPAFVDMYLNQTANEEISCTEPEAEAEGGECGTEGELGENLEILVWYDDGDNEYQTDEEVVFNGTAEELDSAGLSDGIELDADPSTEEREPFENSTTRYVGVRWDVPKDTGNEVQTDEKRFDFRFTAEQARHNGADDGDDGEPQEQEEPPYYQVDLVGGQPIQNLSQQSYHDRGDMIRYFHGGPEMTKDNESAPGQVDCVSDSDPFNVDTNDDTASVNFTVDENNCEVSLVSYGKPFPGWIASRADEQVIFDSVTETLDSGDHSMTVDIPDVN